ncbi:MAG: alpha/beta hydrolase [Treponema sp.]|nr:alpha/beta hydrolase [Treponema sp.]
MGNGIVLIPAGLVVLVLALVLVFGAPPYFYRLAVARHPQAGSGEPNWLDTQTVEDLWIESGDGLKLHAYYAAAPGSSDTVILAHGYSGDGRQLHGFARVFHDHFGMNVLLPDARGHGQSGGTYTGFGWHERLDLLNWIALIKERVVQGPGPRIVLFGISMGAATVLMASGEPLPPEVRLIIADCGYTSVMEELGWQMRYQYHVSCPPLVRAVSRLTKRRAGYSFEEASALEQVKKSRTPTLFIHGEADTFVPFEMGGRLYQACAAEKEFFPVPGAGHGMAYDTDSGEYLRRITLFIEKYMV